MYCEGCGSSLNSGAKYCARCGKRVKESSDRASPKGSSSTERYSVENHEPAVGKGSVDEKTGAAHSDHRLERGLQAAHDAPILVKVAAIVTVIGFVMWVVLGAEAATSQVPTDDPPYLFIVLVGIALFGCAIVVFRWSQRVGIVTSATIGVTCVILVLLASSKGESVGSSYEECRAWQNHAGVQQAASAAYQVVATTWGPNPPSAEVRRVFENLIRDYEEGGWYELQYGAQPERPPNCPMPDPA